MTNYISYSLFGDNPRYTINMVLNAELASSLYEHWKVLVYYDDTVPAKIVQRLQTYPNVILEKGSIEKDNWRRLMWRFQAYDKSDANLVVFRDADSYLTKREKDAVDQWAKTEKDLHIMREVWPGHNSKIMAGMWGLRKNNRLTSLIELVKRYKGANEYSIDQAFLNSVVYPMFKDSMVVHDANSHLRYKDATHEWPSPMVNDQYIGMVQYPPNSGSGLVDRFNQIQNELSI